MTNVFFVPFPKPHINKDKCLNWIKKCGRPFEQLNVNKIDKYKYVCSKHFVGGNGPTGDFPDPITADPYDLQKPRKRPKEREPLPVKAKISKLSAAETLVSLQDEEQPSTSEQQEPVMYIAEPLPFLPELNPIPQEDPFDFGNYDLLCENCGYKLQFRYKNEKNKFQRHNFIKEILSTDKACFHYTGVPTVQVLKSIYSWIEPAVKDVKLWSKDYKRTPLRKQGRRRTVMTLFEEFILTLVRIKRGFGLTHLGYLFGVSSSHVSRIFTTWVNLLAKCFEQLIVWPSKEIVKIK